MSQWLFNSIVLLDFKYLIVLSYMALERTSIKYLIFRYLKFVVFFMGFHWYMEKTKKDIIGKNEKRKRVGDRR